MEGAIPCLRSCRSIMGKSGRKKRKQQKSLEGVWKSNPQVVAKIYYHERNPEVCYRGGAEPGTGYVCLGRGKRIGLGFSVVRCALMDCGVLFRKMRLMPSQGVGKVSFYK